MNDRRRHIATVLVISVLVASRGLIGQEVTVDELLRRTNGYLREWVPQLANVVATETFEERRVPQRRRLTSDLLFVHYPAGSGWMMFRDVTEVDGRRLPHDSNRLLKLFAEQTTNAEEQALRISAEGLRYHLPGATSSATNPFLGMALMQEGYWSRLQIRLGSRDRSLGAQIQVLHFDEREETDGEGKREKLPLLLPDAGRVSGNVWIDVASGRIVKTEATMRRDFTSTSTTVYAREERLGIMLPQEMRTTWSTTEGVAKYSNYRRFGVQTDEKPVLPPAPK